MSTSVTLPALGESVTEGTVSRWLKQVGDTVEADEPLLEISTDKVDTEIPSPAAGVLLEIKAQEDETVEVGAVLAVIGDASEAPSGGGDSSSSPEPAAAPEPEPAPAAEADEPDDEPEPTPKRAAASSGAASGTEVTLPALGESVTEGTVSRWLKQVGETVEVDEPLLEISTDKVDTEIPSPAAGTVLEIRVNEDETVDVGAVLAVIGEAGDAPAESAPEPEPEPEPEPVAKQETPHPPAPAPEPEPATVSEPERQSEPPAAGAGEGEVSYVTPLVRKLAKEHGVDLGDVTGTGVGGRVRKQDVLAAAEAAKQAAAPPPAAPAPAAPAAAAPAPAAAASAPAPEPSSLRGTTEKMSRLRKTIANRMVESLQVSAQLTATVEVDLTAISRIRARAQQLPRRGFATQLASLCYC